MFYTYLVNAYFYTWSIIDRDNLFVYIYGWSMDTVDSYSFGSTLLRKVNNGNKFHQNLIYLQVYTLGC